MERAEDVPPRTSHVLRTGDEQMDHADENTLVEPSLEVSFLPVSDAPTKEPRVVRLDPEIPHVPGLPNRDESQPPIEIIHSFNARHKREAGEEYQRGLNTQGKDRQDKPDVLDLDELGVLNLDELLKPIPPPAPLRAPPRGSLSHAGLRRDLRPGREDFTERFIHKAQKEQKAQGSRPAECELLVRGDIVELLNSEIEHENSLWDYVVVTGDPDDDNLWATTCGEYVSKTWPKSMSQIKTMFDNICSASRDSIRLKASGRKEDVKIVSTRSPDPSSSTALVPNSRPTETAVVKITNTGEAITSDLSVTLSPITSNQAEMVQALAWLLAVLQNGQDGPVVSGIRMTRDSRRPGTVYLLENDLLEPIVEADMTGSCWFPLVPRTATAVDFPTSPRPDVIRGLELSFDLMCYLCGLEYEVIQEGGIVLFGQRSIVFPVLLVDGCVQWHFEPCEPCDQTSRWPRKLKGQRWIVDDLNFVRTIPRHFLGLWGDPEILLGTDRCDFSRITWARAPEVKKDISREGISFGGSISIPRMLTLTWTQTFKVSSNRKNIYMSDFTSKLESMINTPVVLYSVSERRAWMVSFVSVLLHLARARAFFQQVLGIHIPPCDTQADGGLAAFSLLSRCYQNPAKQPAENETLTEEEEKFTVKDYVNDVWAAMDVARRETYKTKGLFRTQLVGYDFADIARMKDTLRMKRHNMDAFGTGWAPLLDEVSLVFFCEGLSDLILPSTNNWTSYTHTRPCALTTWRTIPEGFNLLAASLPCLSYLSEHLGEHTGVRRLTSEYFWHSPTPHLFNPCQRSSRHVCNRLQELKSNDIFSTGDRISSPHSSALKDHPSGVVVFKYFHEMGTVQRALNPDTFSERHGRRPTSNVSPPRVSLLAAGTKPGRSDSGYSSPEISADPLGIEIGADPFGIGMDERVQGGIDEHVVMNGYYSPQGVGATHLAKGFDAQRSRSWHGRDEEAISEDTQTSDSSQADAFKQLVLKPRDHSSDVPPPPHREPMPASARRRRQHSSGQRQQSKQDRRHQQHPTGPRRRPRPQRGSSADLSCCIM